MKCIVLAGGSGDRLWPLSRKNFPKQFMEIKKGRSMFQDAILRNIPFCDEFIIVTNKRYENIARGQLQSFQGLNYSLLLETKPLKTAPAVITAALYADPEDELLVVFTDHVIEGEYNSCIVKAREYVKENKFVAIGVAPREQEVNESHFLSVNSRRVKFTNKFHGNCYYDCGIYAVKAGALLQMANQEFVEKCKKLGMNNEVLDETDKSIFVGLDTVLKKADIKLVEAYFSWTRITDISSYYKFIKASGEFKENIIEMENKNVEIVNMAKEQLIVANGLKDVLIANTRDAVYITKINKESDIKHLSKKFYDDKHRYFEESSTVYEKWGSKETLNFTEKCIVSRITVYPGRSFLVPAESGYTVNYFVSDGEAKISLNGGDRKKYGRNSSLLIRPNTDYSVFNDGTDELIMIQTKNIESEIGAKKKKNASSEGLVKLVPVLKDFIWGGTKVRDYLKKDTGKFETVAESWELSAHSAGQSKIANGRYKDYTFTEYLSVVGKDKLGWKTQSYDRFPLMIKFIDARESLSVQVHPNDDYALPHERDYGKNEMWHIVQADKDAYIYVGFKKDVTREEVKERIKKNTLVEVLNKIPVKSGETYFLRAGTVHAIGAGCLICEVQQSSNVTYRLYDYGRKGKDGKPRELHVAKALDVLDYNKSLEEYRVSNAEIDFEGYVEKLIGECKYFSVKRCDVNGTLKLPPGDSTFQVVVVIGGNGKISNGDYVYPTSIGDTWFCGSNDIVEIEGKCSALVVSI